MRLEEKIIIQELSKHNKHVFEVIFREYYPLLFRLARRYLMDTQKCEDIIQELFIYLWNHAEIIKYHTSLKAYLLVSTRNRCLNHLRDLKIKDKNHLLFIESFYQFDKEELNETELNNELEKAIEKLPPVMARIVWQKYYEGKKIKEIAEVNGVSENTVKTQLQRAKAKIKNNL